MPVRHLQNRIGRPWATSTSDVDGRFGGGDREGRRGDCSTGVRSPSTASSARRPGRVVDTFENDGSTRSRTGRREHAATRSVGLGLGGDDGPAGRSRHRAGRSGGRPAGDDRRARRSSRGRRRGAEQDRVVGDGQGVAGAPAGRGRRRCRRGRAEAPMRDAMCPLSAWKVTRSPMAAPSPMMIGAPSSARIEVRRPTVALSPEAHVADDPRERLARRGRGPSSTAGRG